MFDSRTRTAASFPTSSELTLEAVSSSLDNASGLVRALGAQRETFKRLVNFVFQAAILLVLLASWIYIARAQSAAVRSEAPGAAVPAASQPSEAPRSVAPPTAAAAIGALFHRASL